MKLSLIFCFSCSILIGSCGKIANKDKLIFDPILFDPSREIQDGNLTVSELEIGKRICKKIKQKREHFLTLKNNQHLFKARSVHTTCAFPTSENSSEHNFLLSNVENDLKYVPNDSDSTYYLGAVITEQTEGIKDFCTQMTVSSSVSNRIDSPSIKYKIAFNSLKGFDQYFLNKRVFDANNKIKSETSEVVTFFTKVEQLPSKFHGIEKERYLYTNCNEQKEPKKYSYVGQVWLKHLTSFENTL